MPWPAHSRRKGGFAMIVVILVASIAAISLMSYVQLSLNGLKMAERSFHTNGAMNLAELGLEEAMYCYNRLGSVSTPPDAWAGWTLSGTTAKRTFSGFTHGANSTGSVKVYCANFNPSVGTTPAVVAQATVTLPQGPPVTKMIEVTIRRRSLHSGGLVARNSLQLMGNTTVSAWKSDPDSNPATPFVPYSLSDRTDKALVATASASNGALNVNGSNVDIYGRVASGGGTIITGSNTRIHDATSPFSPLVDPDLVTTDFSASFPAVPLPAPTVANIVSSNITGSTNFPRAGDLPNTDGRYYYQFNAGSKISLTSNHTININADLTFIFNNHSGSMTIELPSNNVIKVNGTAVLHVYTNGNVALDSNTTVAGNREPGACQIYGTNPTIGGQSFSLSSNAVIHAAIYAPNANVTADSNGTIRGSLTANTITFNSNVQFNHDESLRAAGSGNPFGLVAWREMRTRAERLSYASQLSF